jgi:hypothetical protein
VTHFDANGYLNNLFSDPELLERIASWERWEEGERVEWEQLSATFQDELNTRDVFLIARPGDEPFEDRVSGVAAIHPIYAAVRVDKWNPNPVLDAANELANRLRERLP